MPSKWLLALAICGASCMSQRPVRLVPHTEAFFFEADPPVIEPGAASVLRWKAPGAATVLIEESIGDSQLRPLGEFGASGSVVVRPSEDSMYVISCQGAASVSCASAVVRVKLDGGKRLPREKEDR